QVLSGPHGCRSLFVRRDVEIVETEGVPQLRHDALAAASRKLRHGRGELRGLKRRQVVEPTAEQEARDDLLLGKLWRRKEADFRRCGLPLYHDGRGDSVGFALRREADVGRERALKLDHSLVDSEALRQEVE